MYHTLIHMHIIQVDIMTILLIYHPNEILMINLLFIISP